MTPTTKQLLKDLALLLGFLTLLGLTGKPDYEMKLQEAKEAAQIEQAYDLHQR